MKTPSLASKGTPDFVGKKTLSFAGKAAPNYGTPRRYAQQGIGSTEEAASLLAPPMLISLGPAGKDEVEPIVPGRNTGSTALDTVVPVIVEESVEGSPQI